MQGSDCSLAACSPGFADERTCNQLRRTLCTIHPTLPSLILQVFWEHPSVRRWAMRCACCRMHFLHSRSGSWLSPPAHRLEPAAAWWAVRSCDGEQALTLPCCSQTVSALCYACCMRSPSRSHPAAAPAVSHPCYRPPHPAGAAVCGPASRFTFMRVCSGRQPGALLG